MLVINTQTTETKYFSGKILMKTLEFDGMNHIHCVHYVCSMPILSLHFFYTQKQYYISRNKKETVTITASSDSYYISHIYYEWGIMEFKKMKSRYTFATSICYPNLITSKRYYYLTCSNLYVLLLSNLIFIPLSVSFSM